MTSKRSQLRQELVQAGAKPVEAEHLLVMAKQFRQLKPAGNSWWRRRQLAPLGAMMLVGIVLGASIIAYAQTSLPGSWLYPTKRLSEQVAVTFDPGYRAELMMRRSEEVALLVDHHASSRAVLATLADYRVAAASYKSANYAAFDYCKSNLQQAAVAAPPSERTAINSTLASLQT